MTDKQKNLKSLVKMSIGVLAAFSAVFIVGCGVSALMPEVFAATEATKSAMDPSVIKWAFLSAALSVGIGSLGAGMAVSYVGAAAVGAVGEKPELSGKVLIFVGLAEGIAIYGLLIAMFILFKI